MTLKLDQYITLDDDAVKSPNLCNRFTNEDLQRIGGVVWDGYNIDKGSRAAWERRTEAAMDLAMQIVKDKNFPWPGCYSLDTEVLTTRGWQYIDTVQVGQKVYSRDANGVATYCDVTGITRHPASSMVHFQGKSIDLLVTQDHNMVLEDKLGRQHFLQAGEFVDKTVTNRYIPLTSIRVLPAREQFHGLPAKVYLRFLGWYLSEGCRYYSQLSKWANQAGFFGVTGSSFQIAQSREANPEKYEILRADLEACGFTYAEYDYGFTVHVKSMPASLVEELTSLGRTFLDKKIPRRAFEAPAEYLVELLETLILGDGTVSTKNGHRTYFTSSKQLADDVQELCQYVGLRGTIVSREPGRESVIRGRPVVSKHTAYEVTINRKDLIQVAKLQRSVIPWAGEVACVETTPNHTLYVRRNGKAVWCGNCSNIAFPLVTIATQGFHARAYPAIIQGYEIAKYQQTGEDESQASVDRAERITKHMSWQRMEQDRDWEEQHDRMLINLACVGTAFKKSYRKDINESDLVLAKDLVLNYWSKSVETCPRKTHIIPMQRNDIHERILRGTYRNVLEDGWFKTTPAPRTDTQTQNRDNRQGVNAPQTDDTTPYTTLEQYVDLDLDGDGYAEPYIITIEETSKCVLRIATGFDRIEDIERVQDGEFKGKIIKIHTLQYFTKYGFIPSPDGGIYDIGFGVLLGPLNESSNALINNLVDTGTMKNTAGGFLGRGVKIRGGVYTFAPLEWKRVDSTGDDLHKSIFPLPVSDPSPVLFNLLVLLVNYTGRISGSTETLSGENPGQNQPASTTQTVVSEGMKIYNAIFKRIWRGMKEEFRKLYILNGIYMPLKQGYRNKHGKTGFAMREDYLGDPDCIMPAADQNISSESMELQRAQMLKQAAAGTPGYNPEAVERRFLKSLRIDAIDEVYPGPKKMPPGDHPKIVIEKLKLQGVSMRLQADKMKWVAELMEEHRLNTGKLIELHAKAAAEIAEADGKKRGHQIAAFEAAIGAIKVHQDGLAKRIDQMLMSLESEVDNEPGSGAGDISLLGGSSGDAGMEGAMGQLAAGSGDAGTPTDGAPAAGAS